MVQYNYLKNKSDITRRWFNDRNQRIQKIFAAITLLCSLLFSCKTEKDDEIFTRLGNWEKEIHQHPDQITDSLKKLDPSALTARTRNFYLLIKVICEDKNYLEFTSDSLINDIESWYDAMEQGSDKHILSLIYKGIIRIRTGIADSTVYFPLKEAEELYNRQPYPIPFLGFMINFYLGETHYKDNNNLVAEKYYLNALGFAKLESDKRHIFDAITALYWNVMVQEHYETAKIYLDTLTHLKIVTPDTDFLILNMQSAYSDSQGEYEQALKYEKEQIRLLPFLKEKVEAFRIYYSLSDRYKKINEPDSAMVYGLRAIDHIKDTTFRLNYLLYKNIAEIAINQNDYKTADEYRTKMFNAYKISVDERINKRIFELEKQYNLSKAENKVLKAQAKIKVLIIVVLALLILMTVLASAFYKHKTITILKSGILQAEKEISDSHALLLQQESTTQKRLLEIYRAFLKQYAVQREKLKTFEMKIRGARNAELGDDYKRLLKEGEHQFSNLSTQIFTEELSNGILEIKKDNLVHFSEKDRLLLIMLALNASNDQIAALLDTTQINLKSRKSYLKKRIIEHTPEFPELTKLLDLF